MLMKTALYSLRFYKGVKGNFRSRLHRFLRIRASQILKKAFNGYLEYHKSQTLKTKFNKVANYVYLRRVLLGAFGKLKRHYLTLHAGKMILNNYRAKLASVSLNRRKTEYLRTDIVKKLQ